MGEALRSFYRMTLEDPLFAAEGMDLEQGSAALNELESHCKELESLAGEQAFLRRLFIMRHPVSRYVFPVSFLRAFIESERSRRLFLVQPTPASARALLRAWHRAHRALATDLGRYVWLHRVLEWHENIDATFEFQDMAGNVSSGEHINRTLALMEENVAELKRALTYRESLLAGSEDNNTVPSVGPLSAYVPTGLTAQQKYLHELERMHASPFRHGRILEAFGPFSYTLPHFDGTPTAHAFCAYIVEYAGSHMRTFRVCLADQYYFVKLSRLPLRDRGLHQPLVDLGISHWYQPVTSLYATRDQQYMADIATLIDIHRRPGLDAVQLTTQRSSLFDMLLTNGAHDFGAYVANTRERKRNGFLGTYSFFDGLLLRSHPSIYYLPFNKSVWRLQEEPNFLGSGRSKPEDILYQPADVVLATLTPAELELVMRGGRIREEAREKEGLENK